MYDYTMTVEKGQKGYIDEMLILDETNDLLKYSLSNDLDNIKIAIYARTGHNLNLDKACWKYNHELSISVKHLMDAHCATYSMTIVDNGKDKKFRSIVINFRTCNKWFYTSYDEYNGKFLSWEIIKTINTIKRIEKAILSENEDTK